jgi:hypothetical protein
MSDEDENLRNYNLVTTKCGERNYEIDAYVLEY